MPSLTPETAPFDVPADPAGNERNEDATALASGGFAVLWFEDGQFHLQSLDSAGNRLMTAVGQTDFVFAPTNTTTPFPLHHIFQASSGDLVVWYRTGDGGINLHLLQETGNSGTPPAIRLTEPIEDIVSMADGSFIGVYGAADVHAIRFTISGGVVESHPFDVATTTAGLQYEPAVTVLTDGGFLITWTSEVGGGREGILGQRFDAAGAKVGSEFLVDKETNTEQVDSTVTALIDGGYVVTWLRTGIDDLGRFGADVWARVYEPTGTPVGDPFAVETTTDDKDFAYRVAALAGGGFAVTWQKEHNESGRHEGVYAQVFNADGSRLGTEIVLAPLPAFGGNLIGSFDPAVVGLTNGDVVFSWWTNPSSGLQDVKAQIFHVEGPNRVTGTEGDDTLTGTSGPDFIDGLGGNDTIHGGGDNDSLVGGSGNDLLDGEDGNDTLRGGQGDDTFIGGAGDDIILDDVGGAGSSQGGIGNDRIEITRAAGTAASAIGADGGDGNDTINIDVANGSNLTVNAGAGDDQVNIVALDGTASITLGSGRDTLTFGAGQGGHSAAIDVQDFQTGATGDRLALNDFLHATLTNWNGSTNPFLSGHLRLVQTGAVILLQIDRDGGANAFTTLITFHNVSAAAFTPENLDGWDQGAIVIWGTPGDDTLSGSERRDVITADAGNDNVRGNGGDDYIVGGPGDDVLNGGPGDDLIGAGDGNDSVNGASGNDLLYGDAGNDSMTGDTFPSDTGNDVLFGQDGNDSLAGYGGNDTLVGGAGADILRGGDGSDWLVGEDGNDQLYGEDGDDTAGGGDGDDFLRGGAGADHLYGDSGNDIVEGDAGNDVIFGQDGNDFVTGDADDDIIDGGGGADQIHGNDGNDWVVGGAGNDILWGDAGDDVIGGQDGDDNIIGGDGADHMYGDSGNDTITAGIGNDVAFGQDGDDVIGGQDGDDTLVGGAGSDHLYGDAGNDLVVGGDGADFLYGQDGEDVIGGEEGDDQIFGGNGLDSLYGDSGNDLVSGGAANDILFGQAGNDILQGDDGDDRLTGGGGADTLTGGAGGDIFFYLDAGDSGDTITDFHHSEVDLIDLSAFRPTRFIDAQVAGAANVGANECGWHYDSATNTTTVYVDTDGVAGADLTINLAGVTSLQASDFIF